MPEIVRVNLDNEMDLILAHKRTMKLAELCGLSLPAQTTFATAVSEIARVAIGQGKKSYLLLTITSPRPTRKQITASLFDLNDLSKASPDAFAHASRLSGNIETVFENGWHELRLTHVIPFGGTVSPARIEGFKNYFKNEPPLSPYDEIRKKNLQLIDLSEKLQASESQYRILTDTLPLMMFSINQRGEMNYSNKGLKDFVGEQTLQLTNFSWPALLHPDDYKVVQAEWEKALAARRPYRGEGRIQHDGKNIWHLISVVPVKNEKDVILNWIGFFVDIQLQKQIEETLKDNQELKDAQVILEKYQHDLEMKVTELNISNNNLEQFAYIASHDLQEPLRKIRTYTSLVQDLLQLNEQQKYYFDKIDSSAQRMSTLILNVLEYSRLKNTDTFVLVDLNEVVATVMNDFELLIQEKKASVIAGDLPQVKGLPLQFGQLFANLISNALKFCGEKPVIEISSRYISTAEVKTLPFLNKGNNYYEIKVSDNGIGFEPQYAEQIFVIFQRLTNNKETGTGIGLALCKKIVENHGGTIMAEGKPGEGAMFKIYLPAN